VSRRWGFGVRAVDMNGKGSTGPGRGSEDPSIVAPIKVIQAR
jgi:hypothetical protein